MSCCEKCWSDAYLRMLDHPSKSQAEHYKDIVAEREKDGSPCSPQEQSGAYWDQGKQCDSRKIS